MTTSKYIQIFIAIAILTAISILQPLLIHTTMRELMPFQLVLAFIKTFLIIVFYMHLKYENKATKWILIAVILTLAYVFIVSIYDTYARETFLQFFGGIK